MKLRELHESNEPKSWGDAHISSTNGDFDDNEYGGFKNLTSLEGAPKQVLGDFNCGNNQLTSLEGAPHKVGRNFMCLNNQLTSLKGITPDIGQGLWCNGNNLTSLEGVQSKFLGGLNCDNNNITSLVGGPTEVNDFFSCGRNKLTSLEGAPSKVKGYFLCNSNKLTSLEGIHLQIKEINGSAYFSSNPIKSHVLGLLLIDGLTDISLDNVKVEKIINKYLEGSRDVIDCQNELMDAGLDEYAQL